MEKKFGGYYKNDNINDIIDSEGKFYYDSFNKIIKEFDKFNFESFYEEDMLKISLFLTKFAKNEEYGNIMSNYKNNKNHTDILNNMYTYICSKLETIDIKKYRDYTISKNLDPESAKFRFLEGGYEAAPSKDDRDKEGDSSEGAPDDDGYYDYTSDTPSDTPSDTEY
jgi:hypothetical protein